MSEQLSPEDQAAREKGLTLVARLRQLTQNEEGFREWFQEGFEQIERGEGVDVTQELQATEKRMLEELLQRAYTLLDAISHPFRNVERYDVEKWLVDAKQLGFDGKAERIEP